MATYERILILDRGNVEFGVPTGWSVEPDPSGLMRLKDPTDSILLEASYLHLPAGLEAFPVEERLRLAMADEPQASGHTPIAISQRGQVRLAWADYTYECDDAERGERRLAHGRWLLGANDLFQAFLTCYYWHDDASWAVPIWEGIVDTLRLGNGIPLETPKDHWSLRGKNNITIVEKPWPHS